MSCVGFCDAESRKSSLNKRVNRLDEACRAKEAERVDLELRLTQVQENLKKSLAGGALGAAVEAKPLVKVYLSTKYMAILCCVHIFLICIYFCFVIDFQQKDTEHLQWVFASKLCLRDAKETSISLRIFRNCHAESKGTSPFCLSDFFSDCFLSHTFLCQTSHGVNRISSMSHHLMGFHSSPINRQSVSVCWCSHSEHKDRLCSIGVIITVQYFFSSI